MNESVHINKIIKNHNRTANLSVVFADVESYSKRRTPNQLLVVDEFTKNLRKALEATSKIYLDYAQQNNLNFKNDVVVIPTGDGAAVVFSFDGLPDIHLTFAKELLKQCYQSSSAKPCDLFNENGWCNCHQHLNLRIGIAEGKGVFYEDVNGRYNVAGKVINMASRAMNLGDRNQIIFTEEAYNQIIEMVNDTGLLKRFKCFQDVEIKHKEKVNVYQYLGKNEDFINSEQPELLTFKQQVDLLKSNLKKLDFPVSLDMENFNPQQGLNMLERMAKGLAIMKGQSPIDVAIEPTKKITAASPKSPSKKKKR